MSPALKQKILSKGRHCSKFQNFSIRRFPERKQNSPLETACAQKDWVIGRPRQKLEKPLFELSLKFNSQIEKMAMESMAAICFF